MKVRAFKDWRLSEIGFGCYGLSGAYGPVDKEAYRKAILHAFEMGVNFFDTAEGYGGAEAFLGEALAPFRHEVYIATKLSGAAGAPDLSTKAVNAACEASLERLQVDVIDLYQIHFNDPNTPILETVNALEGLVSSGKIRKYGICHLSRESALEYAVAGETFSILMELSPVARNSLDTLLPICQEHGLAAFAFSVTGRGILSGRYTKDHTFPKGDIRRMDPLFKRERFDSALRVRDYLVDLGNRYDKTAVQMGIAWVLAQPSVACALTGTSSIDHLDENLAACEITWQGDDLAALDRFLAEEDERLAEAQQETLRNLLTEALNPDPEKAFNDLIYICENAIILGVVEEEEVIPAFKELFGLRKSLDQKAQQKMRGIQAFLRENIANRL